MNVGEPSGRNRNLGNSRLNVLMNLTPLTLSAGSGPGGDVLEEAIPDKGPQDQPPGRSNTRVGEVVGSFKNSAVELNWTRGRGEPVERSQRLEEAPKGTETTHREGLECREEVSMQEGCRERAQRNQGPERLDSRDRERQRGWRGTRRTGESICYKVL